MYHTYIAPDITEMKMLKTATLKFNFDFRPGYTLRKGDKVFVSPAQPLISTVTDIILPNGDVVSFPTAQLNIEA